jgi:hypothetical protein
MVSQDSVKRHYESWLTTTSCAFSLNSTNEHSFVMTLTVAVSKPKEAMVYPNPVTLTRVTGLEVRSPVLNAVLDNALQCVACHKPRAPLGLYRTHQLAKWAQTRAKADPFSPEAEAARLAALRMDDHRCAVCYAQLGAFIGIPEMFLFPLINRLKGAQKKRIMGFLETRFVFPFCRECVESEHELRVTTSEIRARYDRVLAIESFGQPHCRRAPSHRPGRTGAACTAAR